MHVTLKFKIMTTTIRTSSKNHFKKYLTYFKNQKVYFTSSIKNEVYAITIYGLTSLQTNSLIQRFTKHFRLIKQQEPMALAA